MAVYKVIQDIESEDKLLGPLTLKQFIYAAIVAFLGFINFRLITTPGLGPFRWIMALIFLLPMIIFGVLASPLGRDQPTETWLLSHLRFFLKPHLRVWNQTGISELVTITAPKPIEKPAIKDLSQVEVKSRLKTLANTLDTRGWAFKNVNVNMGDADNSDRLVSAASVPQDVPAVDIRAKDDVMDTANATAQTFDSLIQQKTSQQKQAIAQTLAAVGDDDAMQVGGFSINHFAPPAGLSNSAAVPIKKSSSTTVTDPSQAVKLKELAQSDELKVSSISKLANHQPGGQVDEVVISLH